MATVYLKGSAGTDFDFDKVEGPLRTMVVSLGDDPDDRTISWQPFPAEREAGISIKFDELKHSFQNAYSFDHIVPNALTMEREGIGTTRLSVDALSLVKRCRSDAKAFADLFRQLASQIEEELTQFDIWIEQEEAVRTSPLPQQINPVES